jgi:hypothetical protein
MPWDFKRSAPPSRLAARSLSPIVEVGRGVISGSSESDDLEDLGLLRSPKGPSFRDGKTRSLCFDGGDIASTIVSSPSFKSEGLGGEHSPETGKKGEVAELLLLAAVESTS